MNGIMNKLLAKKVLSILLVLALVCALTATAVRAAYGAGTKFVVLGDSISAGEGASDKAKSYAELIKSAKGFVLANFAVPGHASEDLLKILAENEDAVKAIQEAGIINLSIGGNDLLHSNVITLVLRLLILGDKSAADEYIDMFRVNFAVVIEKIRELNPDALFIVQTLYNSMEGVPVVAGAYEVAIVKLNQVYRDYLAAHPGAYELADVYAAFKGREGLVFRDRIHPSDAGHEMIARVLTAVIDETAPPEPAAGSNPGFFDQVGLFFLALYDYLSYWLSIYSPLELLGKVFSFM